VSASRWRCLQNGDVMQYRLLDLGSLGGGDCVSLRNRRQANGVKETELLLLQGVNY
jgi:hypothetical protein